MWWTSTIFLCSLLFSFNAIATTNNTANEASNLRFSDGVKGLARVVFSPAFRVGNFVAPLMLQPTNTTATHAAHSTADTTLTALLDLDAKNCTDDASKPLIRHKRNPETNEVDSATNSMVFLELVETLIGFQESLQSDPNASENDQSSEAELNETGTSGLLAHVFANVTDLKDPAGRSSFLEEFNKYLVSRPDISAEEVRAIFKECIRVLKEHVPMVSGNTTSGPQLGRYFPVLPEQLDDFKGPVTELTKKPFASNDTSAMGLRKPSATSKSAAVVQNVPLRTNGTTSDHTFQMANVMDQNVHNVSLNGSKGRSLNVASITLAAPNKDVHGILEAIVDYMINKVGENNSDGNEPQVDLHKSNYTQSYIGSLSSVELHSLPELRANFSANVSSAVLYLETELLETLNGSVEDEAAGNEGSDVVLLKDFKDWIEENYRSRCVSTAESAHSPACLILYRALKDSLEFLRSKGYYSPVEDVSPIPKNFAKSAYGSVKTTPMPGPAAPPNYYARFNKDQPREHVNYTQQSETKRPEHFDRSKTTAFKYEGGLDVTPQLPYNMKKLRQNANGVLDDSLWNWNFSARGSTADNVDEDSTSVLEELLEPVTNVSEILGDFITDAYSVEPENATDNVSYATMGFTPVNGSDDFYHTSQKLGAYDSNRTSTEFDTSSVPSVTAFTELYPDTEAVLDKSSAADALDHTSTTSESETSFNPSTEVYPVSDDQIHYRHVNTTKMENNTEMNDYTTTAESDTSLLTSTEVHPVSDQIHHKRVNKTKMDVHSSNGTSPLSMTTSTTQAYQSSSKTEDTSQTSTPNGTSPLSMTTSTTLAYQSSSNTEETSQQTRSGTTGHVTSGYSIAGSTYVPYVKTMNILPISLLYGNRKTTLYYPRSRGEEHRPHFNDIRYDTYTQPPKPQFDDYFQNQFPRIPFQYFGPDSLELPCSVDSDCKRHLNEICVQSSYVHVCDCAKTHIRNPKTDVCEELPKYEEFNYGGYGYRRHLLVAPTNTTSNVSTCNDSYCLNRGTCIRDDARNESICYCRRLYWGPRCHVDGGILLISLGTFVAFVLLLVLAWFSSIYLSGRFTFPQVGYAEI